MGFNIITMPCEISTKRLRINITIKTQTLKPANCFV